MKNKHLILLLTIFLSVILIGCKVPNEIELNNHQFYNDTISPQLVIMNNISKNGEEIKCDYQVSVSISGRLIDNKDPNYKISLFEMYAKTKESLNDKESSDIYNFTKHDKYSTPITHTYRIKKETECHPSLVNMKINYLKDEVEHSEVFEEKIFLQPTLMDKLEIEKWDIQNQDQNSSQTDFYSSLGENAGTITFTFNPEIINGEKTGVLSIKFSIDVNNSNRKFHIDSQIWIVTKNGQYFPLIGLYSYTGPKLKFSKYMNNIISEDIEAEYLVTKIVYNDDFNNKEQASYYKLKIGNINN